MSAVCKKGWILTLDEFEFLNLRYMAKNLDMCINFQICDIKVDVHILCGGLNSKKRDSERGTYLT